MAQGTEKLLRLLNNIQENRHTLNIELLDLYVVDDSATVVGELCLQFGSIVAYQHCCLCIVGPVDELHYLMTYLYELLDIFARYRTKIIAHML